MTSHRPLRSTVDGLAACAVGRRVDGGAPIGAASARGSSRPNGSGYEPSETDCVNIAQRPAAIGRTNWPAAASSPRWAATATLRQAATATTRAAADLGGRRGRDGLSAAPA